MANTWFQFKEFTIHQEHCAMKVSTDACIQGAWAPIPPQTRRVLDIGTGTGLLALMLAQRSQTIEMDAIELDPDAAAEAGHNVLASPWASRVRVIKGDALEMGADWPYDYIICNPPFFNNSLLGPDAKRNQVRHTLSLTHEQLFGAIEKLLAKDGVACTLLPAGEQPAWEQLVAGRDWHFLRKLLIVPVEGSKPNRILSLISRNSPAPCQTESLIIRHKDNRYTDAFIALMRPFYLHL